MQQFLISVKPVKPLTQTSDMRTQPVGVCDVAGEDS